MANFPTAGDDVIDGTAGPDTINALGGNDVVNGLGDKDDLDGGSGDDIVNGGDGDDTLRVSGPGTDAANGGADSDLLILNWVDSTVAVVVTGAVGADANGGFAGQFGDAATHALTFSSIETFDLTTGSGNDSLATGSGNDLVSLGLGDDFVDLGRGINRVDGGGGEDGFSVDFSQLLAGVTMNLNNLVNNGAFGNFTRVEYVGTLIGTGFNDTITTTAANRSETFDMGGGNDTVTVVNGADTMNGGSGSDTFVINWAASAGNVTMSTALAANATLGGFDGAYSDGLGRSATFTSIERIIITTGSGNDVVTTGSGNDRLILGGGDNEAHGGAGDDIVQTQDGSDLLDGGTGADQMSGSAGDDIYIVDDAGDTVSDTDGADEVRTSLGVYVLPDGIETLTGTLAGSQDLRGNFGDNVVASEEGAHRDIFRLQDGGNDEASGFGGNDSFYFGAAFTAEDRVHGGDGPDVLILQGDYSGGVTLGIGTDSNIDGIESISLVSGSVTAFEDFSGAAYSYAITTIDANTAAGASLRINGSGLLPGENLMFDGSAETDGVFLVYGGQGVDTLTGGANSDRFVFAEDRFGAGDAIDGGGGTDFLFLRGDYSIDFNAAGFTGALVSIESVALLSYSDTSLAGGGDGEFDYAIVWNDALLGAGQTITFNGSRLMAGETMSFDGSQETDARFRLFAGAGDDILIGGGGNDLIYGGGGADSLTGNGGGDLFRYQSADESTAGAFDTILDFVRGIDAIDLSRIDANGAAPGEGSFTFIGAAAFGGAAGELRAFNVSADLWQVEGDVDGNGTADLVIQVQVSGAAPLAASDFVL